MDTPLSSILVHLTPYLALNAVLLFSQVSQTTTSLEKGRFSMLSANLKERSITIARASGEERLQLAWQGLNVIFVSLELAVTSLPICLFRITRNGG